MAPRELLPGNVHILPPHKQYGANLAVCLVYSVAICTRTINMKQPRPPPHPLQLGEYGLYVVRLCSICVNILVLEEKHIDIVVGP